MYDIPVPYLSPSPWAHITVAVCFLIAGTTSGADIVANQFAVQSDGLIML